METIKIKYNNRHDWITNDLKMDISTRDSLYVQSIKKPTEANIKRYKKFRNEVLSKQRKAERIYYREKFEINEKDLRKSWNILKSLIDSY